MTMKTKRLNDIRLTPAIVKQIFEAGVSHGECTASSFYCGASCYENVNNNISSVMEDIVNRDISWRDTEYITTTEILDWMTK